ncbi:MAG: CxxC-x17-CxxC domain-containing protein [Patescibacteria group bacterium]|jgi:CxxC-x17-CxxC domain-containing protein
MKNFSRGGGFGDKKGGGGFDRRDSGNRNFSRGNDSSTRPTMHKAVCADCGQSCEVPFRPSGDKPVYCSNCFRGKEGAGPKRSNERDFSRSSFNDKKLFKAVCADCGQSCEVPFRPSGDKPVYCSNCFGKSKQGRDNSGSLVNVSASHSISHEQFEALNVKLDMILNFLKPVLATAPLAKKEDKKEVIKLEERKISKKIVKKTIPAKKINKKTSKKNK